MHLRILLASLLFLSAMKMLYAASDGETYGEPHSFEPKSVLSFYEAVGDVSLDITITPTVQHGENRLQVAIAPVRLHYALHGIGTNGPAILFAEVTEDGHFVRIKLGEFSGCGHDRATITSYPIPYSNPNAVRLIFGGRRQPNSVCIDT